jgi:D-alanine-D-alanine ligase
MPLKVCVLQPDYATSGVDYQYYDPPRNLSHLLPDAIVDHVCLNKLTTYKQLKALQHKGYDVFVNLCEGYLEWEVPSIDVIYTLELLNLPFTGPTTKLYDPPKPLMKYVAYCAGVATPNYVLMHSLDDIEQAALLQYPLFVKPAKAGDSLGVDDTSLVQSKEALLQKVQDLLQEYDELLVEEYIDGKEFTVLVAASADGKTCRVFKPVEYVFPEGRAFKTYALKTSELHPDCNHPCSDPATEVQLREAAAAIFKGFSGVGYARLDFRQKPDGSLYFLEINFTCSVFYTDGYEGSADFILQFDGIGQQGFLQHIIAEGMARHQRKQPLYVMKGNAIAGYGIYAARNIQKGEVVFKGEGRAQRIITKPYVDQYWTEAEKQVFAHYAYPISGQVYILWDDDPTQWAPQNHSCDPNTAYLGLDLVAIKEIAAGEEITADYAALLNDTAETFQCKCGAANCRGVVAGSNGNSVQARIEGTATR